jgi:CoA:oxalate CoA-transferase
MTTLPLDGLIVLDFSQFLAGPSAALRLADLGATVIKIERPGTGDLGRQLYISNLELDGDSTLFHTINRNKQSLAADLKNPSDLQKVHKLVAQADVLIQNFRPGVMDRLGLGAEDVCAVHPAIVYASVTGYGIDGPWRNKPGQDLLAQSLSGLVWLSGNTDDPPIPFGLSVVDMFAGAHLTQGVLACLVRRGITGRGGLVEVSLLESAVDMQFELLTTFLNDGGQLPRRSVTNNANAYLAAPYGIYRTADGYMALAMASVPRLGELLNLPVLFDYQSPLSWFEHRDAIKKAIADHLVSQSTQHWLAILEPADIWCAEVLDWRRLVQHEAFEAARMTQTVGQESARELLTTRCPIRIDGQILTNPVPAPHVGEHSDAIERRFNLKLRATEVAGTSTS